jgi:hypothetical protein
MSKLLERFEEMRSTDFYFAKVALLDIHNDLRKLSKQAHEKDELPEGYKFNAHPIEKNSFTHFMIIGGAPVKLFDVTAEKDGTLTFNVRKDLTDKDAQFEIESYTVDKKTKTSPDLDAAMGQVVVGYFQQAEILSLQEPVVEQAVTTKKQASLNLR